MALPTASDNAFPTLLLTEGTAPASPAAGKRRLYVLSADHLAYLKDSAGVVVNLISNPMTTKGDVIVGDTSGVPIRKAVGTDGQVLTADAASTGGIKWAAAAAVANLASGSATRTAGDITTSSTTLVDATGMSVTITTGARRCLITVQANGKNSTTAQIILDLDIDGAAQGQSFGLSFGGGTAGLNFPLSFELITAALTAASHTFKLRWRVDGGTGTLYASGGVSPLQMQVAEIYA